MGIMDMVRCPLEIVIPAKATKKRPFIEWSKPVSGEMKFNVDGASIGKPGPAGIGGVLRDHMGVERIRFSKSIGVAESNYAEAMAVREAFIIFLASPWAHSYKLIIESDSKNVVSWVLNPHSAPWRIRNIMVHIENLKTQIREWKYF
ncbi:hypothetical protein DITRI_Ditri08aG0128000 [Diplodiscus trichospermus]